MFGLNAFFAALARLTRSVNASADLFDAANDRMASLLSIDAPEADRPALPAPEADAETPHRNGRRAKATAS